MKRTHRLSAAFPLALSLAIGVLGSCAGGPEVSQSGPDAVAVSLSSESEIKAAYGFTSATNPFLPPPGIVSSKRRSFLVVRFVAAGPVSLEISGADLEGESGRAPLDVLGKDELARFWEARTLDSGTPEGDAENDRRRITIDRYALDLSTANILRRNSPYSLLILGPPSEDVGIAELTVRYYVNGRYMETTFPVEFEPGRR